MKKLTASLEDYLEAILITGFSRKVVRVKHLTQHMNVKTSSVINALKILEKRGLVVYQKYAYIELTPLGEKLAKSTYKKHTTLTKFLNEIMGVDRKTAEHDACLIEHLVNDKTMKNIVKFIEFIENYPMGRPQWLTDFHRYLEHGTRSRESKQKRKC